MKDLYSIAMLLAITGILMFFLGFLLLCKDMIIEKQCYELPLNEFYKNKNCIKYVGDR